MVDVGDERWPGVGREYAEKSRMLVRLPSRESVHTAAESHWLDGRGIAVFGEAGSGRTVFVERVLVSWTGSVHRYTGQVELRNVPFAALAAMTAQVTGSGTAAFSPVELISLLAVRDQNGAQRTLVLDDAEHVDDASAAAFAQAAKDSGLRIVLISTGAAKLPASLRALALQSAVIEIEPLTDADSRCLVEQMLGNAVTLDTAHRLAEAAGRNTRYLRELVQDAQESDGFRSVRGYVTLQEDWQPHGRRLGEFMAVRLAHQRETVKIAVELIATTGDIPRSLAIELAGPDAIESAIAADLLETTTTSTLASTDSSAPPVSENDVEIVKMGAGLTSQTVLAGRPAADLRWHAERALHFLEEMNPHTRITVAVHAARAGVDFDRDDRESIVADALRTRQFHSVLVMTESDAAGLGLSDDLALARSRALFEVGQSGEALSALGTLAERSQPARIWAATMHAARGRIDESEALLQPRLADDPAREGEMAARLDLLRARAGRAVAAESLRAHATNRALDADIRAAALQSALLTEMLSGQSLEVLAEITGMLHSPSWQLIPITGQVELLATLFLAAVASGAAQSNVAGFDQSEWAALRIPAGLFLGAEGVSRLEVGDASTAADMLRQALVALEEENRFGMTAYFAAATASASSLVGDADAAAELLDTASRYLTVGGHLNIETERLLLPARLLHGEITDVTAQWRIHLEQARANGHHYVCMRLLHDGWRWGLHDDCSLLAGAAGGVQGALATALVDYPAALNGDHEAVNRALAVHSEAGHTLFAGELALASIRCARDAGRKRPTSSLVNQAIEKMSELSGVDTPVLGRTRITRTVLSPREYDICMRAISGLSSAEIAQQLFLSVRTIEGHLQRAFGKLGIAGRHQMAPPSLHRES